MGGTKEARESVVHSVRGGRGTGLNTPIQAGGRPCSSLQARTGAVGRHRSDSHQRQERRGGQRGESPAGKTLLCFHLCLKRSCCGGVHHHCGVFSLLLFFSFVLTPEEGQPSKRSWLLIAFTVGLPQASGFRLLKRSKFSEISVGVLDSLCQEGSTSRIGFIIRKSNYGMPS